MEKRKSEDITPPLRANRNITGAVILIALGVLMLLVMNGVISFDQIGNVFGSLGRAIGTFFGSVGMAIGQFFGGLGRAIGSIAGDLGRLIGSLWPLLLIGIGLVLLFTGRRRPSD